MKVIEHMKVGIWNGIRLADIVASALALTFYDEMRCGCTDSLKMLIKPRPEAGFGIAVDSHHLPSYTFARKARDKEE